MARPSWIVLPVIGAVALGMAAATVIAGGDQHPSWALSSNVIYRLAYGGIFAAAAYVLFLAVALAWRGEAFSKLTVGPVALESPALVSAAKQLDELALQADAQAGRLRAALDEVADSVDELWQEFGGWADATKEALEHDQNLELALVSTYEELKERVSRLEAALAVNDPPRDPATRVAEHDSREG